jgi:hypothetical protein
MADAAAKAGMSTENWGHIERGYQSTGRGQPPRTVIPPPDTLAHMAKAVRITPEELEVIGRHDAADVLRHLQPLKVPAGVGPDAARLDAGVAARQLLDSLRQQAAEEDRSLAELLVDRGLASADEMVIPDAMPPDPIIEEINASDISDATKARLIKLHLENRAKRFEEHRLKHKKPDGS